MDRLHPNHQFTGVPHTRGTKEYFFCEKGHFTIYVDGEKYLLNRGDVLIFPGDLKHSYGNREQVKSIGFSVVAFA